MGFTRALGHAAAGAVAAALTTSAAAAEKAPTPEAAAIARSPEEIAGMVRITDDPLDTMVRITTEPFYTHRDRTFGGVPGDSYLRAFVDRKSGEVIYQLYFWIRLSDWQHLRTVSYETPEGPVSVAARTTDGQVTSCGRYGCRLIETVIVDLPEKVLRSVSASAAAGSGEVWRFKVSGRYGENTSEMLKTEMAAILLAADRVAARHRP
jgi:hypothetical protein